MTTLTPFLLAKIYSAASKPRAAARCAFKISATQHRCQSLHATGSCCVQATFEKGTESCYCTAISNTKLHKKYLNVKGVQHNVTISSQSGLLQTWMTPQVQYGDVLCFIWLFMFYLGGNGHTIRPLGGILSVHENGYMDKKKKCDHSLHPQSGTKQLGEISFFGWTIPLISTCRS